MASNLTDEEKLGKVLEANLTKATEVIEQHVDSELEKLDNFTDDDLEEIRRKRLEQMKSVQKQKQDWINAGHGTYAEIAEEKAFFDDCKNSKFVVCHFFRDSTFRCKIVDKHLTELCRNHIETKFIKANVEKTHFLVEKLRVRVLPTIALIKDGKVVDYIVGFDDLGGTDEFSTAMMEWRIAKAGVLNYSGDLMVPPSSGQAVKSSLLGAGGKSKTIKGRDDASDDEEDW